VAAERADEVDQVPGQAVRCWSDPVHLPIIGEQGQRNETRGQPDASTVT
jgi:hypothetical protein